MRMDTTSKKKNTQPYTIPSTPNTPNKPVLQKKLKTTAKKTLGKSGALSPGISLNPHYGWCVGPMEESGEGSRMLGEFEWGFGGKGNCRHRCPDS